MSKQSDGGPAFPMNPILSYGTDGHVILAETGMSLRAYFAGQALGSLAKFHNLYSVEDIAKASVAHADALLSELSKRTMSKWISALWVRNSFGEALIGKTVDTMAIGEWPGGPAVVINISPDKNAPEIVFTVKHPEFGEMGIFEHEDVVIL